MTWKVAGTKTVAVTMIHLKRLGEKKSSVKPKSGKNHLNCCIVLDHVLFNMYEYLNYCNRYLYPCKFICYNWQNTLFWQAMG